MSRPVIFVLFLLVVIMVAVFSEIMQRPDYQCVVDGNSVEPITRVEITRHSGNKLLFCSLCCARQWLESHPAAGEELATGEATLTVVDEISGELLDSSLAYWVESESYSRRENKCRVHAFKNENEAAEHIRSHQGREMPGYLAGEGERLSWAEVFTAVDLQGKEQHLVDFRGKVVFLRFWNSGNPFAATDLKDLQQAQFRFQDRGFTILAVNVDQPVEVVIDFVAELGLHFPVLLDPEGKVADRYGIAGFPTGFLIDRSGIIANRIVGELPPDVMAPLLDPLW